MPSTPSDRPTLARLVGLAVIVAVLALALLPNTGAVPADTSCTYGNCPTQTPGPAPIWYVLLLALVLVAAALGVVLFMRRRRQLSQPPSSVEPWSGPAGGPGGPSGALDQAGAAGAGAAIPAYLETPEDVGNVPPEVPAEAPPPAEGGDIDSLMKELDKISGEILQRGKTGPKTPPAEGDEGQSGN